MNVSYYCVAAVAAFSPHDAHSTFKHFMVQLADGRNGLLAAAEHNEYEVVEYLIRNGADATVRDKQGRNYVELLELPWPRDDDE